MNRKLRFYMRGLGIGILVAGLLLSISGRRGEPREMTDAEIRARAAQLGMVDSNGYSLADAAGETDEGAGVPESGDVGEDEAEAGAGAEGQGAEAPDGSGAQAQGTEEADPFGGDGESTDPTESAGAPETTETEGVEAPDGSGAEAPEEIPGEADAPSGGSGEAVAITVRSGMGSESVARAVRDAGLIEDADDFDRYLEANGYSRSIGTGEFQIPAGADYETIAKYLTRRLP